MTFSSDQDKTSFAFHNENIIFIFIMKMKLSLLYYGGFYHKNDVDANLSQRDAGSWQVQSLTIIQITLGRSSRTGNGEEQINYARVLVSSGSTHSLCSVSLRAHSWVYWINALGRRRGSRKRKFSFYRKTNTWGITYWDFFFCHNNGELVWGFSTEKTFVVLDLLLYIWF